MDNRTDSQLAQAARSGCVESFGELYGRHYACAVAVALNVLKDRHQAEDAAQETFAIACRDIGRLRQPEKFASWLRGICRNVAKSTLRKLSRQRTAEQSATRPQSPSGEYDESLQQAVMTLKESHREVVLLHYFSGLSHRDIAATLDTSEQAVHGRLTRARKKIAEYLERETLKEGRS